MWFAPTHPLCLQPRGLWQEPPQREQLQTRLEMRLHASTQLRAVKPSDTNLSTKTGSRKAGRGFCIAKLSGTQWRECGCCYTYTQITHRINVVIALGWSGVLSCSNSYLHVKGHLRAALGFSAFPKRCDRALSLVSMTCHTHHPKRAKQSQKKKKATDVQPNKEQTIVFGSLILLFGFICANISLFCEFCSEVECTL